MKSHSLDQFFNVCQLAVQDISCIHVAVNDHWNCFKYSASVCIGQICIFDTACTRCMQYALVIQQNIKQVNNNRWSEKHWSSYYNAMPPLEVSQYGDIHNNPDIKNLNTLCYRCTWLYRVNHPDSMYSLLQNCVGVNLAAFPLVIECNWSFCTQFWLQILSTSLVFWG